MSPSLNRFWCFNTQPPEGGWVGISRSYRPLMTVSTHSRLKAAGCRKFCFSAIQPCFNTQPPEGGWPNVLGNVGSFFKPCFNTQPPEGGWAYAWYWGAAGSVSTHSRLKAAGKRGGVINHEIVVSTHSRLKAAGAIHAAGRAPLDVSTHSRLKAAGGNFRHLPIQFAVSTHSRLKAAGCCGYHPHG